MSRTGPSSYILLASTRPVPLEHAFDAPTSPGVPKMCGRGADFHVCLPPARVPWPPPAGLGGVGMALATAIEITSELYVGSTPYEVEGPRVGVIPGLGSCRWNPRPGRR